MAGYSLTFAQLKQQAEHAMSGVPDSRTPTGDIVNGALEWLCRQHPWTWLETVTALDVVINVPTLPLPADFGELIDIQGNTGLKTTGVRRAHPRYVMAARVNNGSLLASTYSYVFFLGQQTQTDTTQVPLRTIELGPAPAASIAAGLIVTYRRIIPVLAGDTDVPAVPYGFFQLLKLVVRAFAVSNTTQQAGHDWELVQRMLPDFIAADSLSEGISEGPMESQLDGMDYRFNTETTLGPGTQVLLPGDP
ncbi:MAG TPA: hypothetical protein VG269_26800 [Tepidisphaeraceae bacterium]|nr:hypothetical protein [Tepidisphaeraceae bacterium]